MIANMVTCKGCGTTLVFAQKEDGGRAFPERLVHEKLTHCKRFASNPILVRRAKLEQSYIADIASCEAAIAKLTIAREGYAQRRAQGQEAIDLVIDAKPGEPDYVSPEERDRVLSEHEDYLREATEDFDRVSYAIGDALDRLDSLKRRLATLRNQKVPA